MKKPEENSSAAANAPMAPGHRDELALGATLGQPGQGVPVAIQATTHAGPIPAPDTLIAYGTVDGTFPERIMRMAEQNAETERLTARRSQSYMLIDTIVSRVVALLFSGSALCGSVWLAWQGHDWVAGVIGGTTLVAVTVAFLTGRNP